MSIATIIKRIIGFPFFAILSFIGVMSMWVKYMKNFTLYGGEAIAYTHKMNRKTIADVFDKVQESQTAKP